MLYNIQNKSCSRKVKKNTNAKKTKIESPKRRPSLAYFEKEHYYTHPYGSARYRGFKVAMTMYFSMYFLKTMFSNQSNHNSQVTTKLIFLRRRRRRTSNLDPHLKVLLTSVNCNLIRLKGLILLHIHPRNSPKATNEINVTAKTPKNQA